MKKKFLSLMMAAAVVATTSVSAFAAVQDVTNGIINGSEEDEYITNIDITGDIANDLGVTKPGTLSVTVPTAADFNVNKKGALNGTNITIRNSGKQKVDVIAHKFRDVNGTKGINIKPESQIKENNATKERSDICLRLRGGTNVAYFKSVDDNSSGIFSDPELENSVGSDYKLAEVNPNGGTVDLKLEGNAGGKETGIDNPIQENFTLVLKIKKSTT